MGHTGDNGHPDVVAAIEDGLTRITASGKAAGILTFDAKQARHYLDLGVTFMGVGGDVAILGTALKSLAMDIS